MAKDTSSASFGEGRDPADWIVDVGHRVVEQLAGGYRRVRVDRTRSPAERDGSRSRARREHTKARAHDALDRAFEVADVLLRAAVEIGEGLIQRANPPSETTGSQARTQTPSVLVLPRAGPGEVSKGTLVIENARDTWVDAVRLRCTALVASDGKTITARNISFVPVSLELRGRTEGEVEVTVRVPPSARRGSYVGLVEIVGMPTVTAVLSIEVL